MNRIEEKIRAAGGMIWRDSPKGKQIVIIYRNRYKDWTLPKGKLHAGETWQQAALREVEEETGLKTHLRGFAGAVAYEVDGIPKVVRFWHMKVDQETDQPLDHEVKKMAWLSVKDALKRLSYPLERALLEAWDTQVGDIL
jgi:8-oxo-dGTP diphosphatase